MENYRLNNSDLVERTLDFSIGFKKLDINVKRLVTAPCTQSTMLSSGLFQVSCAKPVIKKGTRRNK